MRYTKQIPTDALRTLKMLFPDSETVFNRAVEVMTSKAVKCTCEVPIGSYYVRIPNKYKYQCKRCKQVISPLSVTPFSKQHTDLTDTLFLACRFYYAGKIFAPKEISNLHKCRYETAKKQTKRVIQWMQLAIDPSGNNRPKQNINDNKVIKIFSKQNDSLSTAVDSLFHALPSLRVAMKNNSIN